MLTYSKEFTGDLTINEGERAVVANISTTAVDRDGDVLLPSGLDASEFRKNPVVLFGHDSTAMPVGKAVSLHQTNRAVAAKVLFADRPDTHPDAAEWAADTVLSLMKQKVLRAFSVGFMVPPEGRREATDKDKGRFGNAVQQVITRWKLLEFSIVPIPSNPDALATMVSKGALDRAGKVAQALGIEPELVPAGPEPIRLNLGPPRPIVVYSAIR